MKIPTALLITAKIGFLVIVLGLLIGHGSQTGPIVNDTGMDEPCARFRTANIPYVCIDEEDTQGDIAQLNGVTTYNGDIIVENTSLTSLEFLSNISAINGSLIVAENSALTTISSVAALTQVNSLVVDNNPSLVDLVGLGGITAVPGQVVIKNNVSLSSLAEFSIGSAASSVTISGNTSLQDLAALANLQNVTVSLGIGGNNLNSISELSSVISVGNLGIGEPNITSLSGLSALETIDGRLTIAKCDSLTDLSGMPVLTTYSDLTIQANPMLTSLAGLPIVPADLASLSLINNGSLVDISALSTLNTLSGIAQIHLNPAISSLAPLANVQSVGSLSIRSNALLTELGLSALQRVDNTFVIQDNQMLCQQDAQDLLDQVLAAGGVGAIGNTTQGITISGNQQVCNP